LARELRLLGTPGRLLVQYVPHAFGWKAMNLPLCLWLSVQGRLPMWIMFHEVAFVGGQSLSWKHKLLAWVNRLMVRLLLHSAERAFVSIPGWEPLLRSIVPNCPPITWLPVPSNIPTAISPSRREEVRSRLVADTDTVLLGHFGTFGRPIARLLTDVLPVLLTNHPERRALLIGREGESYARDLERSHPALRGQVMTTGATSGEQAAEYLAACDVLVQPYPDGASARRGSLMAGLALGLPIITTNGSLSEPLWRESGAVELVDVSATAIVAGTERLLQDRKRCLEVGRRARQLYSERFSLEQTIARLQACSATDRKPCKNLR
jgi:glycosyltransferase involved in cell wall biosynthesis